jgi:hypothetical protein
MKGQEILLWPKEEVGLNFQGVYDAKGRFLDVYIGHPGSTSNFLAFCTSSLKYKLESPGFLKKGKCLFGLTW